VSAPSQTSVRNGLLRALAHPDYARLQEKLEPVPLAFRAQIVSPNEPIEHVFFPEAGIGSIIARTSDGRRLEVGLYGRDGMSGASLLLGVDRTPHEHIVQSPGSALRIPAADLLAAIDESASLHRLLLRYVQVFTLQTTFTALSNGGYDVQERLARWLLMCDDRADDGIHLTHEFLSTMLGVRRSSVTVALQTLEAAGLITAGRGHVKVVDRPKLEEAAGESYGVPEAEYRRLIGLPA
jgi:CRP-like cAMP-binding protein